MGDILKQLLNKLISYFLFILVLSFIFVCLMAGEFPPKISTIKSQYKSFIEMKSNYSLILKNTTEKLKKANSEGQTESSEADVIVKQFEKTLNTNQQLLTELRELRLDQVRMAAKIQNLEEQNKFLIQLVQLQKK